MRILFLAAGVAFLAIGIIGIFLPLLPTTPFLILASGCFARSSRRLETWLLDHPRFGPFLSDWRRRGAIPRNAKLLALAGTTAGFLFFLIGTQPGPGLAIAVAALILTGLAYVFTRPS